MTVKKDHAPLRNRMNPSVPRWISEYERIHSWNSAAFTSPFRKHDFRTNQAR